MRILVTGAAGRLGSCVCRLLVEQGMDFVAVDKVVGDDIEYPVQRVDLSVDETVDSLFEGIDALIHLANYSNWSSADPETVYTVNTSMNMRLFSAAVRQGCRRIVFSSSVQVLDGQMPIVNRMEHPVFLPYLPLDSEMPAISRNSYGLSKQSSESMLQYFSETAGATCVAIRYPLLIDSVMMAQALEEGGMPRGNPYDAYAYLPVYSGAEVAVCALLANVSGYRCYFVASKDNLEQKLPQEVIAEGLAEVPCRKALEQLDSLVDCSSVVADLGWQQPRSMSESLEKYGSCKAIRKY